MIPIDFTPESIDALHHERFHHPRPRVQEKMEAVYLKSQGLLHEGICRLSRISEDTLRSYLRQFQQGGIERLKRLDFAKPQSEPPTAARRSRTTSARTRPVPPARPPPRLSASRASGGGRPRSASSSPGWAWSAASWA